MVSIQMSHKQFFIGALLLMVFAVGCGSAARKELINAQFYFDRGMKYMNQKDYIKALTDFQTIIESYQTSDLVDRAQFMLSEAHYMNEDYVTAAYEYERVFADFPSSEHAVEARYKRALCYYNESPKADLDQENTRLAIDDFNRFIDNYPSHELSREAQKHIDELRAKLAYKDFKSAELYRKLKKYDAALIYYQSVIRDYSRTTWADESRFGIGLVYLKQKKFEQAKEVFQRLVNTTDNKDLKDKSQKKLAYIENRTKK